jgi:hypothetical protein
MWRVYYNNGVDPILEVGIYESKRLAISAKRNFIYISTKDKIYNNYEESRTDFREYNIMTIIEKIVE